MILKKDKKGFVFPVIGVGLAVVIAIIVLMTFIFVGGVLTFLKNNFFMILGAGVLLGGFIFLIKGGGSTKVKTTIFLVIVAVAVLFAFGGGFLEQTFEGEGDYLTPIFYYDKCEAIGSLKHSLQTTIITKSDQFTSLQNPSVTNFYSLDIIRTSSIIPVPLNTQRLVYHVCPEGVFPEANSCSKFNQIVNIEGGTIGTIKTISNIGNDEVVYAQAQKLNFALKWVPNTNQNKLAQQIHWLPYGIRQYNVLGGSPKPLSDGSCTYNSKQTDTLIQINGNKINSEYSGIDEGTNQKVLQPEEVRWYVGGHLYRPPEDFILDYQNQEAWCRPTGDTGEIYKENSVSVESGKTYKIASADWSDFIDNVDCCPGQSKADEVCNEDFEYESILGSEPGPFGSCGSPNWVPYDEKKIVKYFKDDNGVCQNEIKDVGCASNFDCQLTNQVCDVHDTWTCVDANINLQGQTYSGQNIQNESESKCSSLEESVEVNKEYKKGVLSIFGVGKTIKETEVVCKTKDIVKWIMLSVFLFGLILAVILLNKPRRRQSRRRRR